MKDIITAYNDWQNRDIERLRKDKERRQRRNNAILKCCIVFLVMLISLMIIDSI